MSQETYAAGDEPRLAEQPHGHQHQAAGDDDEPAHHLVEEREGPRPAVFVQFALGRLSAKGANVMWLHVPLGVMLVGLGGQAIAGSRRLGEE